MGHGCKVKNVRMSVGQNGKVHLDLNISSFAHNCECMVDGGNAMAAI